MGKDDKFLFDTKAKNAFEELLQGQNALETQGRGRRGGRRRRNFNDTPTPPILWGLISSDWSWDSENPNRMDVNPVDPDFLGLDEDQIVRLALLFPLDREPVAPNFDGGDLVGFFEFPKSYDASAINAAEEETEEGQRYGLVIGVEQIGLPRAVLLTKVSGDPGGPAQACTWGYDVYMLDGVNKIAEDLQPERERHPLMQYSFAGDGDYSRYGQAVFDGTVWRLLVAYGEIEILNQCPEP